MSEKLLTVNEAAQLKGVTRAAIYAAVKDQRLPHVVVLGHIGLREQDVKAWTPLKYVGRPKGLPLSEQSKKRISESQKRRWAKRKQQ